MLRGALSVPGLGLPDPGLVSPIHPQQQLLLADASEPQVPTVLLGNMLPGCMEVHAGLVGPCNDFLELQEAGQVLWGGTGGRDASSWETGAQSSIRQQALLPACRSGMRVGLISGQLVIS